MLIGEMEALFVKYGYLRSGWQRWDPVSGQNLDFNDSNEVMEDILQRVKDGELILESASGWPSASVVEAGRTPTEAAPSKLLACDLDHEALRQEAKRKNAVAICPGCSLDLFVPDDGIPF